MGRARECLQMGAERGRGFQNEMGSNSTKICVGMKGNRWSIKSGEFRRKCP